METHLGGLVIDESLATLGYYGIRIDPANGRAIVDVAAGGNQPVPLQEPGIVDPNAHRQWVWSKAALFFSVNSKGHLEVKIT